MELEFKFQIADMVPIFFHNQTYVSSAAELI